MRTVLVGNRELAKHVLTHLLKTDWNVVGAIAPTGSEARKQAGYTPFDGVVADQEVKLIETKNINDNRTRSKLEALEPDLCICPGWDEIIDESILEIPERGFIGFHASNLPKGRGGAPVNWTIISGNSTITLSLFYYTQGVDAGDVIHTESVDIEPRDTVDTVLNKLAMAARNTLSAKKPQFESESVDATKQSLDEATYRPRRQPQDGVIDWTKSAASLDDWIRAQTDPYPGAFTFYQEAQLTVWNAECLNEPADDVRPGTVLRIVDGSGIDVATGNGVLRLSRVQFGDKPRMWADDFAHSTSLDPGSSLGWDHAPKSWVYTGIRDRNDGTNFATATNLTVGKQGEILAVIRSKQRKDLTVTAALNNKVIQETQITCTGRETVSIPYTLTSKGTYTLRIKFQKVDGGELDKRYLKLFVTE